jgi:SAM-dependent methyltransferase
MTSAMETGLDFSGNYDEKHAWYYYCKHRHGFWRRLSNWRECAMVHEALRMAGNPSSILDMPCGTGRFWDVLAEDPERIIHAGDNSQAMIDVALAHRAPEVVVRIHAFRASAFAIPLTDGLVESAFCSRFMHHLSQSEDRMRLLKELGRVARESVILSMWVDGNLQAGRRQARDARRQLSPHHRVVIPAATVEAEFAASGFTVVGHLDFLPRLHMLRTYVLRRRHAAARARHGCGVGFSVSR